MRLIPLGPGGSLIGFAVILAAKKKPAHGRAELVEVAGVEPASLVLLRVASTCIAFNLLSLLKRYKSELFSFQTL